MNDKPQKVPFGQTTGGIILVQGVVTAVVSAIATWFINNATDLPWLPIAGVFFGLAIVFFLLTSLVSRRLRQAIWGSIARFFGWISELRLTTARQRVTASNTARAEFNETMKQSIAEAGEKFKAQAKGRALESAKDQIMQTQHDLDLEREKVKDLTARLAVTSAPALPPPEPRWALLRLSGGDNWKRTYEVRNLMPDSSAFNVRVDASSKGAFHFDDAAFWKDLSGENSGQFKGRVSKSGAKSGFNIVLSWLNENQAWQSEKWWVAPFIELDPWETPF